MIEISMKANQIAEKLGVRNISEKDEQQIEDWLHSITVENLDQAAVVSRRIRTNKIDFNRTKGDEAEKIIRQLSVAFRYLFTNTYAEFIFFPSEGRKYSLQELLDVEPGTMFSDDVIYSFPTNCLRKRSAFDQSVDEYPLFCHDPETTFLNIRQKLVNRGQAVIVSDEESGQIVGFTFGYKSSLKEAWYLEEWIHPFVYSRFDLMLRKIKASDYRLHKSFHDRYVNRFDDFLVKFNVVVSDELGAYGLPEHREQFEPDDCVFIFNAIVTHPLIRTSSKPSELCGICLNMVDGQLKNSILGLGEAVFQSNAYKMFQIGGMKDIYGVLNQTSDSAKEGDNVLMVGPLSSVLEVASLPQREFMKRYIRFHREKRKNKM